jgi:hypothetical protein
VDAFLLHAWVKAYNRDLEYRVVTEILNRQVPPAPTAF